MRLEEDLIDTGDQDTITWTSSRMVITKHPSSAVQRLPPELLTQLCVKFAIRERYNSKPTSNHGKVFVG
jgi:hypothetical protein